MKMKKFLFLVLSFVIVLSASSCSGESMDVDSMKKILCRNIYVQSVPDFTIVEYDCRDNDDGSSEQYYVLQFGEEEAESFIKQLNFISDWKNVPVHSNYSNICTYVTPIPNCTIKRASDSFTELNSSDNCIYFFKDRTKLCKLNRYSAVKRQSSDEKKEGYLSDGTYSSDDSKDYSMYSTNFSVAFFDKDNNKLYLYIYDEA